MKHLREMDLDPKTKDEIEDCLTPDGMRRRLFKYSFSDALTRNVYDMSKYRGLSGEDTMTVLAFEALRRLEKLTDQHLEFVMTNPMPPIIFQNGSLAANGSKGA